MTVNQFMRRVKYDVILSSLDIPLTVNGKKEMNFNSQICTSREQSERLLALGLKKETADIRGVEGIEHTPT